MNNLNLDELISFLLEMERIDRIQKVQESSCTKLAKEMINEFLKL